MLKIDYWSVHWTISWNLLPSTWKMIPGACYQALWKLSLLPGTWNRILLAGTAKLDLATRYLKLVLATRYLKTWSTRYLKPEFATRYLKIVTWCLHYVTRYLKSDIATRSFKIVLATRYLKQDLATGYFNTWSCYQVLETCCRYQVLENLILLPGTWKLIPGACILLPGTWNLILLCIYWVLYSLSNEYIHRLCPGLLDFASVMYLLSTVFTEYELWLYMI